jgi:hypothetical protein
LDKQQTNIKQTYEYEIFTLKRKLEGKETNEKDVPVIKKSKPDTIDYSHSKSPNFPIPKNSTTMPTNTSTNTISEKQIIPSFNKSFMNFEKEEGMKEETNYIQKKAPELQQIQQLQQLQQIQQIQQIENKDNEKELKEEKIES